MSAEKKDNPLHIHILMVGLFLGSRILFWHAGVRFNIIPLSTFWQYLDVTTLSDNLLEGVYYLHSQPPLFNLFLGSTLKLFPESYPFVFNAIYLLFGLAIYFGVFQILNKKISNIRLALILASIFIITPEAILYENWLMYTWPLASLLVIAAYALMIYEDTSHPGFALLFILVVSFICLTRSAFHPLYLVFSISLVVVVKSGYRRTICLISFAALVLVGALLLKNLMVFGFFGTSSWFGMNLWTIAPKSTLYEINENAELHDIVRKDPFLAISDYPEKYGIVPEKYSQLPQLSSEYKGNGKRNFNHYGYISLSRDYQELSLKMISNDLMDYLGNVLHGWVIYSKPAWQFMPLMENRTAINKYINLSSLLKLRLNLEKYLLELKTTEGIPITSYLVFPAALLVIAGGAIRKIINRIRFKESVGVFNIFIIFTILYLSVVITSLQLGENNRMRVMSDPLIYIAVILAADDLLGIFNKSKKDSVSKAVNH